jgi:hypothetical protein
VQFPTEWLWVRLLVDSSGRRRSQEYVEQPFAHAVSVVGSRVVGVGFACEKPVRSVRLEGGQVARWRVVIGKAFEQLFVDPTLSINFDYQTFHQFFWNEQHRPYDPVIRFAFGPCFFAY